MRTETPEPRGEGTEWVSLCGNTEGATAKILPACKTVFVGAQLELTKESLEVKGNFHPRCMTVPVSS